MPEACDMTHLGYHRTTAQTLLTPAKLFDSTP